jgi:biopolymer transport protein ExbB
VFELFQSGGFLMWPILACSVAAMAIVCERLWTLNKRAVTPGSLGQQVQQMIASRELDPA